MIRILQLLFIAMVLSVPHLHAKKVKYDASHYKYIGTFVKVKSDQKIESTMSLENFQKIIRKDWAKGYDISEIKYGNGKWIGVFTKNSKETHQTYIVARRFSVVNNLLKEYWNKGYYITNIEHGLSEWIVVFEKNTSYTNQAFERRKKLDIFIDAVNERWKDNFDLIDLEYGEGRWTGIFAEGTGYKGQAMIIRSSWRRMVRVIEHYWEKDYQISNIEYTLGKWMVVFSKSKDIAQGYETAETIESFKKKFEKRQQEGYKLIDLAEGW